MNLAPSSADLNKPQPSSKRPPATWIDYGILIAVLLVCGVTLSRNMADPDLWGHVQYGRDALAGGLPVTTTYSYIAEGYPWVNHEIVSEFLLALGADSIGPVGLMIVKTLLGVMVVGVVVYFAVRQGVSLFAATLVALLVGLTLADHWSCRPQLFSYLSTTAMFALLTWCFEGWEGPWRFFTWPPRKADEQPPPIDFSRPRMKLLWLMPVLMVAWTNAHGGFLAGFCIFTAYLGLRGIEAILAHGWEAIGIVKRFVMMILATGLATFLNPYGPNFHQWLYDDLKVPRPEILEWRAPDFTDPLTIPYALLLLMWVATLLFSRKQKDFTQTVITGLLVWQSMEHSRHGAFFAIACGFWLPAHFESLLQRLGIGTQSAEGQQPSPLFNNAIAGGLAVTYLLLGYFVIDRVSEMAVPRDQYPVSALDYLGRNSFKGKLMCTFNWAQYALAGVGPQHPGDEGLLVHVDGRCRTSYSQEMLDAHFDFILGDVGPDIRYRDPASGPYDPARILREGNPDLVLLCRTQENSVATMEAHRDAWTLLYQDSLAQVWGRSAKYADPASPSYVPAEKRLISETKQTGSVMWPAFTWRGTTTGDPQALATGSRQTPAEAN